MSQPSRPAAWQCIVIVLLPLTAAARSHLLPWQVFDINLYAYRQLVLGLGLLILPIGMLLGRFRLQTSLARRFMGVLYLWLAWGVLSLLWAPSLDAGAKQLLEILLGVLAVRLLLGMGADHPAGLRALTTGWLLAFLATVAVAAWEVRTGQHLPGIFMDTLYTQDDYYLYDDWYLVAATFGNPNDYAAFLALALPFLLLPMLSRGPWLRRLLAALALLPFPYVLVNSGGRLGFVAAAMQALLLALLTVRRWGMLGAGALLLAVLGGMAMAGNLGGDFLLDKAERLVNVARGVEVDQSMDIRANLYRNGIWMTQRSWGLGVGAGGFETLIERQAAPHPTLMVINPHNFWLEVLSQYGVVVFGALVLVLLHLAWTAWRGRGAALRADDRNTAVAAEMILLGLAGYLLAALASSAYIPQPTNWIFLGSLAALGSLVARRAVKVEEA